MSRKKHVRCVVMGCQNHRDEGEFVGNMCVPCHRFVVEGVDVACTSQAYRNALHFIWTRARSRVATRLADLLCDFVQDPHLLGQKPTGDEILKRVELIKRAGSRETSSKTSPPVSTSKRRRR